MKGVTLKDANKNQCSDCRNNKNQYRIDNLCTFRNASDGHIARCTSFWAEIKHKIVADYSGILTVGMRNRFNEINYIDLYSGPGKYFDRENGIENEGSALIAYRYRYSNIFLNDLDVSCYNALKARTKQYNIKSIIFNDDANNLGTKINGNLNPKSLSFCLLDPNKMGELNFTTISQLTRNRLVDLLINFPIGHDFKRGFRNAKSNKYDAYFNSNKWLEIRSKYLNRDVHFLTNELIKIYLEELFKIGYARPPERKEYKNYFPIKMQRNVLLYYLIFVSKHQKGYDFCEKIRKYIYEQPELNLL